MENGQPTARVLQDHNVPLAESNTKQKIAATAPTPQTIQDPNSNPAQHQNQTRQKLHQK